MKVALFSAKPYDVASFTAASGSFDHELEFFEDRMRGRAAPLAEGFPAVCVFVNDTVDARVLEKLVGRRPLRGAAVRRVQQRRSRRRASGSVWSWCTCPAYSPNAVAEHTLGVDPGAES